MARRYGGVGVNLKFLKEKVKGKDRDVSTVVCILVSNISFRISHVHTVPTYVFSDISYEFQKCRYFF